MTLKQVAENQRDEMRYNDATERLPVIEAFEADPDFTLRERVEALIRDLERPYSPGLDRITPVGIARRLHSDVLGEKP